MTDDATKTKAGGSPRLSEELGPLPERWYVVDRNGLATVCADEADARLQELQSRALYHRHAPYRAVRLVDAITVDALRAALASMTEDRDSWARQAADREQDALDLVAAERDCRTCRNFRGTQHCHSVLRCVDGSSYQRGGVVQLWEAAPVEPARSRA